MTYSDTGLFGVYATCEPLQCEETAETILNNWRRLSISITDAELEEAKNRLITKLLRDLNGK